VGETVVIGKTAASPGAPGDAARRETAPLEGDGVAAGQPHHERDGRRDVSSGRHPAVTEEVQRVVDGLPFDDAVQVDDHGFRAKQRDSSQRERLKRRDACRLDRNTIEREATEVAVVAGSDQCATGGRGDQPAGGACRIECTREHRRELLRNQRQATGRGVDAVQLGGIVKTGEAAIACVEERANVVDGRAVRQQHVGAHRVEAVHDPLLWT
jgi:hypothetical protein